MKLQFLPTNRTLTTPSPSRYQNPQGAFYAQSKTPAPNNKAGTLGLIAFTLLSIITATIYLFSSVSTTVLVIGATILVVCGFRQRRISS